MNNLQADSASYEISVCAPLRLTLWTFPVSRHYLVQFPIILGLRRSSSPSRLRVQLPRLAVEPKFPPALWQHIGHAWTAGDRSQAEHPGAR